MGAIINVSIDLNKIDKNKIKSHANGAKYYQLTINVADKSDQYGNDVSVTEPQSKEERMAKKKKQYLGSGKVVWSATNYNQ